MNAKTKHNHSGGFTLIELMVAVSIFAVVALIISATVAILISSFNQAQNVKLVLDNLNFAMQNMVLDIKEGTSYQFASGDDQLAFEENPSGALCPNDIATYILHEQAIYKICGSDSNEDSFPDMRRITSEEIMVDTLEFLGHASPLAGDPGASLNPGRVTIYMHGSAVTRRGIKTEFSVQTTVSQRQTQK